QSRRPDAARLSGEAGGRYRPPQSGRAHPRWLCGFRTRCRAVIVARSQVLVLLPVRSRVMSFRCTVVRRVFLAVDRCHMHWISVGVRSPDSKLLPVRIDPFPEVFAGDISLIARLALDAHDISRKPVAIAAAGAAAVVRPVTRRLQAACDRLTVIIAERAGDARRQSGLLGCVERMKEF